MCVWATTTARGHAPVAAVPSAPRGVVGTLLVAGAVAEVRGEIDVAVAHAARVRRVGVQAGVREVAA